MQETSLHALLDLLKSLQVPIGAALGALTQWLFTRWKRKPELSILEANAAKTEAETRKLDGETLDRAYDRIDELVIVNYQLRKENLGLQREADLAAIRDRHNEVQRKRMKGLLDIHGIPYSELDEPNSKNL